MVFIVARSTIFRNKIEIADCAWMLMATMYVMIINIDSTEFTSPLFENTDSEQDTNKSVFEKLCRLFKANESEPVEFSIDILSKMLEKLKETDVIQIKQKSRRKLNMDDDDMDVEEEKDPKLEKSSTEAKLEQIKGMFDHSNVQSNYQNLYNEYEKKMNPDQLDERFLLEE
jgi:hypothetical protein